MSHQKESIYELIKSTSTRLPKDVENALKKYAGTEKTGTPAKYAFDIISENIKMAADKAQPICQDTGSILFFVKGPKGFDQEAFVRDAKESVALATEKGILRQNSVDSLTGKNSGNNIGAGAPYFHFEQVSPSPHPLPLQTAGGQARGEREFVDVRLILKGGGCENVGAQYSLPNQSIGAERNIEGVQKAILDAVFKAQGKGCAPGFLGVAIGGDRATGYAHSKEQLLRRADDTNPDPVLRELEEYIVEKANTLGIGPMGFGGKTTLFGCKICALNRVPASYFVTISYMCWAFRRQGIVLGKDGGIEKWIY